MTGSINNHTARKSLGQHWLSDNQTLEAIVNLASISAADQVLEIGPGLGHLTEHLLARGAMVTAVEADSSLINKLAEHFKGQPLTIINQDILQFDFSSLPPNYKIVANIPYYLTSHLFRVLFEQSNLPVSAVLLVQKEVAERLAAKAGQMSLLAVSVQFYANVSLGQIVSAELFTPKPKVDSQLIHLQILSRPRFAVDPKAYFQLVKAGFSGKRKTLHNSLSSGLRLSKDETKQWLTRAKIDPGRRAQSLSLADWNSLYRCRIF